MLKTIAAAAALSLLAAGCSSEPAASANDSDLKLRTLTMTNMAAPLRPSYPIEGDLIPTPSDQRTRYYLLQHRRPILAGTVVALLREEKGNKAAYARVEIDCAKRLFHIVGVGNRRAFAETSFKRDGPLRSMAGFPLREEIARYVCERQGTPLA
ncbi:hypothetical protein SAMN06297144_2086 [Sphingomonas guangdongensis]|uniref:Lipoprotein n=1 Tax=Sphingomonas guangdongensis TaxID=1141890 RepID=A0A285R3N4_9SPHN|nr:hypothetical protein [Sphingomonas guangdongensis]SOB86967.1 hypothetical protein SAMN06297144_2086 [Sphingomonas guangdongensis]